MIVTDPGNVSPADDVQPLSASTEHAFARLRMTGPFFEGAKLPIDSVVELQRFKAMVLHAASLAWQEANPNFPLPADFETSLQLVLTDLEQGSTVSVIERPAQTAYDSFYELGVEEVNREIVEIERWFASPTADRPPLDVAQLPLLDEPAFAEFGTSLPPDSGIAVYTTLEQSPPVVTYELRNDGIVPLAAERAALLASPPAPERTSARRDIAGQLITVNAQVKSFELLSVRYGKVHGRYNSSDLTDNLKVLLQDAERAPLIRMNATLRFQGEVLKSLLDANDVRILAADGQPWNRRFVELASLDPGWDEDSDASEAIEFVALDAARALLLECQAIPRPLPGIFPMTDGGVQIEWASAARVTSVEISPNLDFALFDFDVATKSTSQSVTTSLETAKEFLRSTAQ